MGLQRERVVGGEDLQEERQGIVRAEGRRLRLQPARQIGVPAGVTSTPVIGPVEKFWPASMPKKCSAASSGSVTARMPRTL